MDDRADITQLLDRAGAGDRDAWEKLVQLVYPDLKRLARNAMPAHREQTFNTTALVHECYLRLANAAGVPRDCGHLMALAVRIMRQLLVDHARERLAAKRGGGAEAVPIEDAIVADERQFAMLVEIDDALTHLGELEPRQARVFECRYFGGLNDDETALALGVSPRTVHRDWDASRRWLAERLSVT